MTRTSRLVGSILITGLMAVGQQARAQPAVQQQVDAIFDAWQAMDTPQNRALAKQRGMAMEAKLFSPIEKPGIFSPHYAKFPHHPNFRWSNSRGIASLAITDQGLAMRTYKGGKSMSYYWGTKPNTIRVAKRTDTTSTSKLRPLHWPLPGAVARALPKLAQKIGTWRAKRLIRKAVRAEKAPQPAAVCRALKKAAR